MGIEKFGESLLSQQRERQKEAARDDRKVMYAKVAGKLIGAIGNEYLSRQAESFFNNEENLQKNLMYKNAYNAYQSARTLESEAQEHKTGYEQYWIEKAKAESQATLDLTAGSNYNPANKDRIHTAWAMERASQLREAHEQILKSGKKFTAAGAVDADTYETIMRNKRPDTILKAGVNKFLSFFDGDEEENTAEAIRESGMLKSAEEINQFNSVFSQLKNADIAYQLTQDLKDVDFGDAPLSQELKTIKQPNEFGEPKDVSVLVVKQGNEVVNILNATTKQPIASTPESRSVTQRAVQAPQSTINAMQTVLNTQLPEEIREDASGFYEKIIGDINTSDPNAKQIIAGGDKVFFGTAAIMANSVKNKAGISGVAAPQIALTSLAENYKLKEEMGVDLITDSDGYSPLLTLASIERLQNSGDTTLQSQITEDVLISIVDSESFDQNFKKLSLVSKKKVLDWMDDYKVFTRPTFTNGASIKDALNEYMPKKTKREEEEEEKDLDSIILQRRGTF